LTETVQSALRVRTVAVIGAGSAGRAFAFRAVQAGFTVVLEDVMPEKLRRAQDEYGELPGMRFALTVEDAVREAEFAIDFVPDELESKLEIFSMLDRMAPPRTILCTPTRALSITDLASCTYRSERCVGVRFDAESVTLVRSRFLDDAVGDSAAWVFGTMGYAVAWADDVEPMLVKNQS